MILSTPRMEDSIDQDRGKNLPKPYCKYCLKTQTIIISSQGEKKMKKKKINTIIVTLEIFYGS